MYWSIIILTTNYKEIADCFCNEAVYCSKRRSSTETHIWSDFITIDIYPYNQYIDKLRGHKADIVYLEDEAYNNEEIRGMCKGLCPMGIVLPIRYLYTRINYEK